MRLSDFILLNEEDKKLTVMHLGVPLAKRDYKSWKVFLFQLEGFYVETLCNTSSKAIEEYRVFGDTQMLLPYLQGIPIDDFLN